MSDCSMFMDDLGYTPVGVLRGCEEKQLMSNYKIKNVSVFRRESLFNPECFVNGSCSWRVAQKFSLCVGCDFRFQRRLVDVVFSNPVVGKPLVRAKRRFQVNSKGVSVKERGKGECILPV